MSAQPVRRTMSAWKTVPRDGTTFHILNTLRFNPFAKRFQILCHEDDGKPTWHFVNFAVPPSMWLRRVPLPYEIPTSFAFTVTYTARRKTWRERIMDRLFGWVRVPDAMTLMHYCWRASAMSAGTDATTKIGAGLQPASAGPQDDAHA